MSGASLPNVRTLGSGEGGDADPLEPPAARVPQSALLRQAGIKLAFELLVLKAGAVGRGR